MHRREALQAALATALASACPWPAAQTVLVEDETWHDDQRRRPLPVRLRWPADDAPMPPGGRPLVLFSHGLGGRRQGAEVCGSVWAAAGFVVLHLQHPGMSPGAPLLTPERAFAAITRPSLCVTGSRDGDVLGNGATPQRRLAAYAALPAGHKALLLLRDADHMSFAGQTCPGVEILPREAVTRDLQPGHHALVAAISTDWWRSTLLGDAMATERLLHPGGLGEGDVWQRG